MKSVRWYHRLWWRLSWWVFALRRSRPRVYVHHTTLERANNILRSRNAMMGRLLRNAPYRREHHRDLLTGVAVAHLTGLRTQSARGRPGPIKYGASTKGAKLVGRPVVYERRVEPANPFSAERVRIVRVGETEWLE